MVLKIREEGQRPEFSSFTATSQNLRMWGVRDCLSPTRKIVYLFRENRIRLIKKAVMLIKYVRCVLRSRGGYEQLQWQQHLPTVPMETHQASTALTRRSDTAPGPVLTEQPPLTSHSLLSALCSLALCSSVLSPLPFFNRGLFLTLAHANPGSSFYITVTASATCCGMGN